MFSKKQFFFKVWREEIEEWGGSDNVEIRM